MVARPPARGRLYALLALLLLAGGFGAWRWQALQAEGRAQAIASFNLNAAMDLAGTAVPANVESFYFFVLDPAAADERSELADTLRKAASEDEFLGITGADMEHNRRVLRGALEGLAAQSLKGLVIVYVGPQEQQAELAALIAATGAELRFVAWHIEGEQTL